jgi:hypothetical protein
MYWNLIPKADGCRVAQSSSPEEPHVAPLPMHFELPNSKSPYIRLAQKGIPERISMSSFSPHQRYMNEAEPELGIGIVTKIAKGRVQIHFPLSRETRLYAAETASSRRVRFKIGDTIADRDGRSIVIDSVQEEDG